MAQQQSPFLEAAYGWNFGEGGWNSGMDQNLLKFSFMFDRNVDSIVASLPAAVNGQAHYLTTDNRLYFAVGSTYFSTPVPKWFTVFVRSTGQTHQYNGTSLVQIDSPAQLDSRLDAVELTVANLGTAAFQSVEFFATQAELDVVSASASNYTDALRGDLADPAKGSAMVAFGQGNVSTALSSRVVQVATIADLRNLEPAFDGQQVELLGHTASGIGGGIFYADYNSVAADDNGVTVVTVGGKRWLRRLDGFVSPTMFGAIGDGVVDDTAPVQSSVISGKSVLIPTGDIYRLTGMVDVPDDVEIYGAGEIYVDQNPYIRALNLRAGCRVDGVKFRGRSSATAMSEGIGGGYRGVAISASNCDDVRVTNCKFYSFVSNAINVGAGIVGFGYSNNMAVTDCYFDDSNDGFFDIESSYFTGDCVFSRNISYSNSDVFIGISSVGSTTNAPETEISAVSHHVISDNIHIKRRGKSLPSGRMMGRHAISIHYTEGKSYATITGNIFGVCSRHGVYMRGNEPVDPKPPIGPNIVANNFLIYCGNALDDPSNYHSGIMLEVNTHTVVTGNHFFKSGYTPTGNPAAADAYDISTTRGTQYVTITNNMMRGAKNGAIYLNMSVPGYTSRQIIISENQIASNGFGIFVGVHTGAVDCRDIKITGNIIQLLSTTAMGFSNFNFGIGFELQIGQSNSLEITGNTVTGLGKTNGQYGLCLRGSAPGSMESTAKVHGNTFINLYRGFASWRVTSGPSGIEYVYHKAWGVDTRVKDNTFQNCAEALFAAKNANNALAFVEPSNKFIGCDSTSISTVVDVNSTVVIGEVSGVNASGVANVNLRVTAPPSSEAYSAGDSIVNPAPTAGGYMGSVCVTAGSPGVWKSYGSISV